MKKIELDFGTYSLDAELFETEIARRFADNLPYTVSLTRWGNEAYGSIETDLGEECPVPEIPSGGLAYTSNGNYFCIFYGQTPAWAVEYIGQITGNQWEVLVSDPPGPSVVIREKKRS